MEAKTQNTILRVTHDCDLSDVIVGLIRGHRGTKGCTMREIHKFLHNDYIIEIADDLDFFRHLFVSCKKLIKNGRLFRHGCKYRVSYSELSQDQMPNDVSLVMDKSAEQASVYVCELCKENDEGKKALEISVSMTKDITQSELLQLTSLPNKCFLCHSTSESDRLYLDSTLPDNSFNCSDADVTLASCPPSAASPVHSFSSVPGTGLSNSSSDLPLVSGDTHSAVLNDIRQSDDVRDRSSLSAIDRDSSKPCSNLEVQLNGRLGNSLKSCDTSENPTGGSEKRNESKIRQTKNRRTQVKFLTDGLTPFYSSEGKRKRPSNIANSASSISPSKAKKLRDRTDENEGAGEELSSNHKRLKRPEKQRNLTSFYVGADVRKSRKMSATSAESHGTYRLLVGIKEDILFPHITGEDVKLFETARSMAVQRLQQKLYNMDILSSGTELASVNSPPCQNWTPNILLPLDYEDDTSSRTLIDGSSAVQGYDQPMDESVEAVEASQALSSTECSYNKNNDNYETSFSECEGADDHEFSDDDNGTPVVIKENTFPEAATASGDVPCSLNDAEDVSTKAADILAGSDAMEHQMEEFGGNENETVVSANGDETADDNSIPAVEANGVLSFQNENVEIPSTDSTDVKEIAGKDTDGEKMIMVDDENTGMSASCTDENNVTELHEDIEVVCPNISTHVVEGTVHNTASAHTDVSGISNVEISLDRGIDAAFLTRSVTEGIGPVDENLFVHDGIDMLGINASDDKSRVEGKEDEMAAGATHEISSKLLNSCPRNDEISAEIVCKDSLSHNRSTSEIPNNNGDDDKDCCEDTVDNLAKDLLNVEVAISVSSSDGIKPRDTPDCISNRADNGSESTTLESTEQLITDSVISDGESFSGHVTGPDEGKDIVAFEKELPMEQELPIAASTEDSFINHLCVSMELENTAGEENTVTVCDQASASFLENSDPSREISETRDQDVIEAHASPNQEDTAGEVCMPSAATEQLVVSSRPPCLDSFMEDFKWTSNEESIADQNCTKEIHSLYFDQDKDCVSQKNCADIAFLSVEIFENQDKNENTPSTHEQLPRPKPCDDSDTVATGEEVMDQTSDEVLPSKRNRKRKLMFCPDGCCSNDTDVHCKVMKTNDTSPKTKNGSDMKQRSTFQQSPRRRGRPKKNKGLPSDELKPASDVSPSGSDCMFNTLETPVAANAKVSACPEEPGLDSTSASEAAVRVESSSVTDVAVPNCGYATIASDALIALGPLVSHQAPSSHDIAYRKVAAAETCDPTAMDVLVDNNAHFLAVEAASAEREASTLAFSESQNFTPSEISIAADAVTCSETLPSNIPAVSETLVSRDESVFGEMIQGFDSPSSTKQPSCSGDSSMFGSVLLEQWNGLEETVVNERTGFGAAPRDLEASRACSMTEESAALLNSAARDVVASYESHEMSAAYVASDENNSWVTSNELSANACSVSGRDIASTLADVLSSRATQLESGLASNGSSNIEVPQMDTVHLHQCGSLPNALSSAGVYSSCLVVSESESQNMIVHFGELSSTLESKSPVHRPEHRTMSAENSLQVELLDKKELLGLMKLNNLLPSDPVKNDFVAIAKGHNCRATALDAVEDFNAVKLSFHENAPSDGCQHSSSASAMQECYVPFDSLSAGCRVQNSTDYRLQSENHIQMTVLPPSNHVQLPSDTSQMLLRLVDPNVRDCRAPLLGGLNAEMYVAASCHQVPTAAYVTDVSNVQSGNLLNNSTPSIQTQRQMDITSFLGSPCVNTAPSSVATATNASSSAENGIQEGLLHVQPSNLLYALPLQSAMLVNSLGRVYSADASLVNVPSNFMYVLPMQSLVAGVNFDTVDSTETANKNLCNKPDNNNPGAGVTAAQCPMHCCNGRSLVPQLLGCQPYVIICPGTIPMSNILQPLSESLGQCHPHSCPSAGARHQAGHGSVLGNLVSPLAQCIWGVPSQSNISAPNVVPAAKPPTEMNSGGEMFVLSSEHQHQGENRCSGPQVAAVNICGNTYGTQVLNSINASQFVSENLLAHQFVGTQNLSVQLGQIADATAIALQVQAYSPCK